MGEVFGAHVVRKQTLEVGTIFRFYVVGKKTPPSLLKYVCHCRRNSLLVAILLFLRQSGILILTTIVGIANWGAILLF
jgi:hypothetical protein